MAKVIDQDPHQTTERGASRQSMEALKQRANFEFLNLDTHKSTGFWVGLSLMIVRFVISLGATRVHKANEAFTVVGRVESTSVREKVICACIIPA